MGSLGVRLGVGARLGVVGTFAMATSLVAQPVTSDSIAQRVDQKLTELAEGGFAGTVLVAKSDEVLLVKGYGHADRMAEVPFTEETVSTIGSITKQFTGAAILKLHEDGLLEPDDPLSRFFPRAPADKAPITLHQLLTHTAGFPGGLGPDEAWIGKDEYVDKAFAAKLRFEPGRGHHYSNTGYSILAAVIEQLSGTSYESFLRSSFFEPLGMTRTGYVMPDWSDATVAVGYRKDAVYGRVIEKQQALGHDSFSWHLVGNGGIHSTVGDLHRWIVALRGGQVLSQKSLDLLFAPHADEGGGDSFYGYGWVRFDLPSGETMIGHNGGNGYFFADVNLFPDRGDLHYAILVNDPRSEAASNWVRRLILQHP